MCMGIIARYLKLRVITIISNNAGKKSKAITIGSDNYSLQI